MVNSAPGVLVTMDTLVILGKYKMSCFSKGS